jgi:hypothetical protein
LKGSSMRITNASINERTHAALTSTNRYSVSPASGSVPHRWRLFSGADGVFCLIALLVFLTARKGLLDDPGLGWHLRNVDVMLAQGSWLTVDPFSEPRAGKVQPYYANQWLGEIPFWLGERWAGEEGIAAVAALVIAFTMRCLHGMLVRDGSPWPVAFFWTCQAAMGISCSWVARPNLFTLLFVLITSRICILFHEGGCSRRTTFWLLPLFALWANVHGGFLAGFVLLGATLTMEMGISVLSLNSEKRSSARSRAWHLLLLLGGAFLCTLINPYGLSLYRWLFQLLGDPFFMDLHSEWKSPDFHAVGAMRFEWLMLFFPLVLALSKRRPQVIELGLAVLWLHFALNGFRYVPLWILIVVPLLARATLAITWLHEQARRILGERDRLFAVSLACRSWPASLVAALILLASARCSEGRFARHRPDLLPTDALDRFLQLHQEWEQSHGHRPVVFHSYDWGGYLTWHGAPTFRNWIDDRNEVQGREHVLDYFAIMQTEPGWREKLDRDRVQLICIHPKSPLAFRLADQTSRWCERYRDEWAVIFQRVPEQAR